MVELTVSISFTTKTTSHLNMPRLSASVNKLRGLCELPQLLILKQCLRQVTGAAQCPLVWWAAALWGSRPALGTLESNLFYIKNCTQKPLFSSVYSVCENLWIDGSVERNFPFCRQNFPPYLGKRAFAEVIWYFCVACCLAHPGQL